MIHTFISAFVLILLIIDPFGNIPVFSNTLKYVDKNKKSKIIFREHLIAFFILVGFIFVGQEFLKSLGLSNISLQIAGGIILFLISIKMIFPPPPTVENEKSIVEPFIVPLAIPLIAGPSALATVMLLVSQEPSRIWEWILAVALAIIVSATVLSLAIKFQNFLGERYVLAIEKLMGLILVALSVEMIIRGVKMLIKTTEYPIVG